MRHLFSSIQWTFFILANIIVFPVAVGFAFNLSPTEIASLLQRVFFVIGITSLLQGLFGHKLPLNESPAGLWLSVFLVYATYAATGVHSSDTILRSLEMGILLSGVLFLILSSFKLIDIIKKLFTPVVTATYLILLVSQLSGPFVEGILGIGYLSDRFDPKVALCAIVVLILTVVLANSKISLLSSYSLLISLTFGWILFALVGIMKPLSAEATSWISFPVPFAWGYPIFDTGIILTSLFTSFLLLTNLVASANAVSGVIDKDKKVNYNRAGFVMGINHMIASCFSAIGSVPIANVAGFISTTKIKEKLPYIIACSFILIMSFFPVMMTLLSSLPVPVGYATVFLTIAKLISIGLKELKSVLANEHALSTISLSLMVGFGLMFIPNEAFTRLPEAIESVANNGLIVGVIICIILDQTLGKKNPHRGDHSEDLSKSS